MYKKGKNNRILKSVILAVNFDKCIYSIKFVSFIVTNKEK